MTDPKRAAGTSEIPALLQAVRATVSTIDTRGRIYRLAVVAIAITLLSPLVLALVLLSWRPLPYLAMLVPVVGAFVVADGRAVLRWQRRVLDLWLSSDMDLADLRDTVEAMRHLPTETVNGMLDRLPPSDGVEHPSRRSENVRASSAQRYLDQVHRHDRETRLWTAGATLIAGSIATGLSFEVVVAPLIGALAGMLVIASSRLLACRN